MPEDGVKYLHEKVVNGLVSKHGSEYHKVAERSPWGVFYRHIDQNIVRVRIELQNQSGMSGMSQITVSMLKAGLKHPDRWEQNGENHISVAVKRDHARYAIVDALNAVMGLSGLGYQKGVDEDA